MYIITAFMFAYIRHRAAAAYFAFPISPTTLVPVHCWSNADVQYLRIFGLKLKQIIVTYIERLRFHTSIMLDPSSNVDPAVQQPDCRPLRTNAELLAFERAPPFRWNTLVDPLNVAAVKGAAPRLLGAQYEDMDSVAQYVRPEEEAARPKVLVCHDLAGNYRGDRYLTYTLGCD